MKKIRKPKKTKLKTKRYHLPPIEKTDWLSTEFNERVGSVDVIYSPSARYNFKKLAAYCKKWSCDKCSLIRIYERKALWERFDGQWINVTDETAWRAAHANSKSGSS